MTQRLGDIRTQYERLRKNFERVTTSVEDETKYLASELAFDIMKTAQANAPVSTEGEARHYPGYLRASAYVNKPYSTSKGHTTLVGFRASYAFFAHEDPRVGKTTGGPYFLLKAFQQHAPAALPKMAKRIDQSLGAVLRTTR